MMRVAKSSPTSRLERAIEPVLPDHLLAVGVQRVVNDPLRSVDGVIVRVAKVAEAFGNSLQTWALRLVPKRIVGIGAVDDLAQQHQGEVAGQVVLLQNRLERTLLAVVAQFDVFDIEGNGCLLYTSDAADE